MPRWLFLFRFIHQSVSEQGRPGSPKVWGLLRIPQGQISLSSPIYMQGLSG
jgi:hypothetical protein